MSFININRQKLQSSTSGTFSIGYSTGSNYYSTSSGNFTTQLAKTTYNVLGEDVEIEGPRDGMTSIMVAQLNVLGKEFYYELKKQNCHFPQPIEDFLQKKFEIEETAKYFIKNNQ